MASKKLLHPYIYEKTSLSYIRKLYVLHIKDIRQLIQPCGTRLMNLQNITNKFGNINITMKRSHKKLQIRFCDSRCTHYSQNNCSPGIRRTRSGKDPETLGLNGRRILVGGGLRSRNSPSYSELPLG